MTIHSRVHHQDTPRLVSHYRIVSIKAVRKPLERQISEALFIATSDDDVLLNSGAEWGVGRVLVIDRYGNFHLTYTDTDTDMKKTNSPIPVRRKRNSPVPMPIPI